MRKWIFGLFLIVQSAVCSDLSKELVIKGIQFNCNCHGLPKGWTKKTISKNWMQTAHNFPPKNKPKIKGKWCPRGDSNSHVPKNGRF